MIGDGATYTAIHEWANTVVAVLGVFLAVLGIWVALRSNKISQGANDLAKDANAIAAKALQMQEDESQVRLIVKPNALHKIGGTDDQAEKPVLLAVEVINLSTFPVTVTSILWKATLPGGTWLYWKYPTFFPPFQDLPVRLPSRESFTAYMDRDSLRAEELAAITAAGVVTACGETIEGTTDDWKEASAKMVAE